MGNIQTTLSTLELKNLVDVDPNLNPTNAQVLTYNGNFWTALDTAGGLPEAPIDGNAYVWKDEAWVPETLFPEAPNDGNAYVRGGDGINPPAWNLLSGTTEISNI